MTPRLLAGAAAGALVGGVVGALQLWSDPEPCADVVVLVGTAPTRCPHPDHVATDYWSEDWSALHIECECKR